MTLAVFGGSFDPPHIGHVLAVQYLLSVGAADRVLVVPVFAHAHDKPLSPYDVRFRLCRAAFEFDSRVSVSDVEAHLPPPSYTQRTLERLHQLYPQEQLRLVVGTDVIAEKDKWYRFDLVEKLAPPLVLGRRGHENTHEPRPLLPEVSSTDLRERLARRSPEDEEELRHLIPAKVRDLIRSEGLYR